MGDMTYTGKVASDDAPKEKIINKKKIKKLKKEDDE